MGQRINISTTGRRQVCMVNEVILMRCNDNCVELNYKFIKTTKLYKIDNMPSVFVREIKELTDD